MEQVLAWIAPVATIIAAMMTAANINARVTGWGFVIFVVGSIAWLVIGVSTGQANLVISNCVLTLVNAIGVWRWLGRQRAYDDGGQSAKAASRRSSTPTLFTATGMAGMKVSDSAGAAVGETVEALVTCETGQISYIVVRSGGVGGIDETLRAVVRSDVDFGSDHMALHLTAADFDRIAALKPGDWPEQA